MKYSHTIDQINIKFIKTWFDSQEEIKKEIVFIKELPASRIAYLKYTGNIEISVIIKQLHSRSTEEYKKHSILIKNEYDTLNKFYNNSTSDSNIKIIRPLACFSEMLAHVTEAEFGNPLDVFLKQSLYQSIFTKKKYIYLLDTFSALGDWLNNVSRLKTDITKSNDLVEKIISSVYQMCEYLIKNRKINNNTSCYIKDFLEKKIPELKKKNVVNTFYHGDFLPGNIMIQKGKIIIFDFSDSGIGTTYYDLATMIQWLEFLKLKLKVFDKKISVLQNVLVEKFIQEDDLDIDFFNLISLKVTLSSLLSHLNIMEKTPKANILKYIFNIMKLHFYSNYIKKICRV